jgi:hypothetical protein
MLLYSNEELLWRNNYGWDGLVGGLLRLGMGGMKGWGR